MSFSSSYHTVLIISNSDLILNAILCGKTHTSGELYKLFRGEVKFTSWKKC